LSLKTESLFDSISSSVRAVRVSIDLFIQYPTSRHKERRFARAVTSGLMWPLYISLVRCGKQDNAASRNFDEG
jgi:hypothetical protein